MLVALAAAVSAGACSRPATARDSVSEEERGRIFWGSPEETLKPTRWDSGDTTVSNEARLELLTQHARDLGGGYVGVGSDQNFVLAAWAKSEWIWMMDFTRIVVAANKVHLAFLREAATPEDFRKLWLKSHEKQALALIKASYETAPDYSFLVRAYRQARSFQTQRFAFMDRVTKARGYSIWLTDQAQYQHIRGLAQKRRIRPLGGDLNGTVTLRGIGEAARKMGVPIRIFYPSNAEEYTVFWPYKESFRANLRSLPVDERSVVLRTISIRRHKLPWAAGWEGVSRVGFHYNKQPLGAFQQWLALEKPVNVFDMLSVGEIDGKNGFSIAGQAPNLQK